MRLFKIPPAKLIVFFGALIFAVGLGYNVVLYLGEGGNVYNPETPLLVKLTKDVLSAVLLGALLFFGWPPIRKDLRSSDLFWILAPALTACAMLLMTVAKGTSSSTGFGVIKNYGFYFPVIGLVVWLVGRFGRLTSFLVIITYINLALLAGGIGLLSLGPIMGREVTFSGRLVGLLGNPNYVGFASVFGIATLIQLAWLSRALSPGFYIIGGLISITALGLSQSFGSAAAGIAGLVLYFSAQAFHRRPQFFVRGLAFGAIAIAASVGILAALVQIAPQSLPEKIHFFFGDRNLLDINFIAVRIEAILKAADIVLTPSQFLIGDTKVDTYIQADGAWINLLTNFGVPTTAMWALFFFFAVQRSLQNRALQPYTWFLVSQAGLYFGIHYIPEAYPTCLLVALVSYVCIFSDLIREEPNAVDA